MLASLFANGDIGDARVIVFGLDLRRNDKKRLRASCGAQAGRLEFVDMKGSNPALRWLGSLYKYGPALYTRLFIPEILAQENDRLLYMDCDMIVLSSLRPLMELDLGDCAAAAVPDAESAHPAKDGRVPFPADAPYFNSGLILMDLPRWRERNLTQAVLDVFEREGEGAGWGDQDALNLALMGQWKPLDLAWNVTRPVAEAGCRDPKIVHFTGTKPWTAACKHPGREHYLRYRALTPWRNRRLTTRFENRIANSLFKRRMALRRLWTRPAAP
jgi:lipopolysaccharide biosynthesis glycosyltransferase